MISDKRYIEGLVIGSSEKRYDFSQFSTLAQIEVCVAAFSSFLSTNERSESRERSDTALYHNIVYFLRFCQKLPEYSGLNERVLREYFTFCVARYRETTVATYYQSASRIVRYAIQQGLCKDFQLPRLISVRQALASSRGGATLADYLEGFDPAGKSHNDLNRSILAALKKFCWRRSRQAHSRFMSGQTWLRRTIDNRSLTNAADSRQLYIEHFVGRLANASYKGRRILDASGNVVNRYILDRLIKSEEITLSAFNPSITRGEIIDYVLPGYRQISSFMPLFALARLNPCSILELTTDMLVDAPTSAKGSAKKVIRYEKARSRGELRSDVFNGDSPTTKSLASAWAMLVEMGDQIREEAEPRYRNRLFLVRYLHRTGSRSPGVYPVETGAARRSLKKLIDEDRDPQFHILRCINGGVNLKLIRTTVANVVRHRSDLATTQGAMRHSNRTVTEGYLNNSEIKGRLDDRIEAGQEYLLAHVTGRISVVPNGAEAIQEIAGVGRDVAQSMIDDEFVTSFGVSIVEGRAYVIDTPLNCLRVIQWLEKLDGSSFRLQETNAARWQRFWQPQIEWLRLALHDFPRKTIAAAKKLGEQLTLAFPEPN